MEIRCALNRAHFYCYRKLASDKRGNNENIYENTRKLAAKKLKFQCKMNTETRTRVATVSDRSNQKGKVNPSDSFARDRNALHVQKLSYENYNALFLPKFGEREGERDSEKSL